MTAKVKICDKSYLIHAEIRILILFEMKSRDISSSSVVCCSLSSSLQSKQQLQKLSFVNSLGKDVAKIAFENLPETAAEKSQKVFSVKRRELAPTTSSNKNNDCTDWAQYRCYPNLFLKIADYRNAIWQHNLKDFFY